MNRLELQDFADYPSIIGCGMLLRRRWILDCVDIVKIAFFQTTATHINTVHSIHKRFLELSILDLTKITRYLSDSLYGMLSEHPNRLLDIFEPLPSLPRYIQLNDIHNVIHGTQYPWMFLQILNHDHRCELVYLIFAAIVDLLDYFTFLDLVDQFVYFVLEMKVGQVFQDFVLDFHEELADLPEFCDVFFVTVEQCGPSGRGAVLTELLSRVASLIRRRVDVAQCESFQVTVLLFIDSNIFSGIVGRLI